MSSSERCDSDFGLDSTTLAILILGVAFIAALYSSIGHAGASGYIALMTLVGIATAEIRPAALVLNLLVATVGSLFLTRTGHFSWQLFWPFALTAVPAAFLGGALHMPLAVINYLLGLVLLFSAWRLFLNSSSINLLDSKVNHPNLAISLLAGTIIGLLSGLTGTGGGIFLTPLLLFCRWADTRTAASVTIVFIGVNSAAGLIGHLTTGGQVPSFVWLLTISALSGGLVGSLAGRHFFSKHTIHRLLALIVLFAGLKLLLGW